MGETNGTGLKPGYRREQLGSITLAMLLNRLSLIDNRTAHHIARELLGQWLSSGSTMSALSTLAELALDKPAELSEDVHILRTGLSEKHSASLAKLCPQPRYLLEMLGRLQHVSFRDMVMLDPQQLQEEIESTNPLLRLLLPQKRLTEARHVADFLADNIDRLPQPHRGTPYRLQKLVIAWLPVLAILAVPAVTLAVKAIGYSLLTPAFAAVMFVFTLMLIRSMLAGLIRRRHFQRTLALYISFTDEFVGEDQE